MGGVPSAAKNQYLGGDRSPLDLAEKVRTEGMCGEKVRTESVCVAKKFAQKQDTYQVRTHSSRNAS